MFKKNKNRQKNEVSAGSMADIAFLLLIFFLVATTINNEKGIATKLEPYHPEVISTGDINKNTFMDLYLNAEGAYMLEGSRVSFEKLKDKLKEIVLENKENSKKTIINLTHDRGTVYKDYLACFNEINRCYNEIWQSISEEKFDKPFTEITKKEKIYIRDKYPKLISENKPTSYAGLTIAL